MIQISRILCPVDFSEFSLHALDHAAALAGWYKAGLTVLYVLANVPAIDLPPIVFEDQDRARIMSELRRFTAHVPAGVRIDHVLREATDIHRQILSEATSMQADLMVIGSHGRSGFERLLLGSVTEKVMRKASCPTMVVPRRAADTPPDRPVEFHRIVCPIDFSEASERALAYATSMAEEANAQLIVLHVIETPPELRAGPLSPDVNVDAVRAAAEAECLQRLRTYIPSDVKTYCTVTTAVREGAAYREIVKVATGQRADLIVMGTHGRGAIDRLVFGSNTARVTRAAACPVLIVPG